MFKNLPNVMCAENIGVEDLAKILGVHRNTVANKIDGSSEFTLTEIEKIKAVFSKYSWEFLFARGQESA